MIKSPRQQCKPKPRPPPPPWPPHTPLGPPAPQRQRCAAAGEEVKTIEVPDSDLEVTTMRSGGPGGQHVNKTESAVRVRHIPTGLAVRCDAERSQLKNKVRQLLLSGCIAFARLICGASPAWNSSIVANQTDCNARKFKLCAGPTKDAV